MGKVGDDPFGHFLADILRDNGVDTSPLVFSNEARTALAFVSIDAHAERSFMFYRHPSADMLFRPDEVAEAALAEAEIFHFGSIGMISDPSRAATLHCLMLAQAHQTLISYDPNLRLALWPSAEEARAQMLAGLDYAHILKVSEEEVAFMAETSDLTAGVQSLWREQMKLVVVTQGKAGCTYFTATESGHVAGIDGLKAVDTTGAGDGFVAGLLAQLHAQPELWTDSAALQTGLRFANAVGGLATTQLGAIPALPNREAVSAVL
jgi:fructokinase